MQDREGGGDSQWGQCGGGGGPGELELLHSHSASVSTQLWGGLRQGVVLVWVVWEIVVKFGGELELPHTGLHIHLSLEGARKIEKW